jgi:hypothetical protein
MSKVDPTLLNTQAISIPQPSAFISQDSSQSQSLTPSILSKSRSRNESDNEDDTKRQRKKEKIDLGQAITNMADELRRSREAKQEFRDQKIVQEKAIDILYKDYENRLDNDAFVEAINVLESESKARIFTRLKADEKRDRWLEVAISTELLP